MRDAKRPQLDHRADERRQRDDRQHLPGQIDAARARGLSLIGDPCVSRGDPCGANRQVDPENRAPAERRDQHSADDRPRRDRHRACRRPYPDRVRAQAPVVAARLVEKRERVRQHRRRADALQSAGGDQLRRVGCEARSRATRARRARGPPRTDAARRSGRRARPPTASAPRTRARRNRRSIAGWRGSRAGRVRCSRARR